MKQELQTLTQKRDDLLREANASGTWDQSKYDEVQTLEKRLTELRKLPDPEPEPELPLKPPKKGR